jgi:hypothetical protein
LALIGLFRSRASLQAKIWTLRHQLNVLGRKSPQRLTFISIDRLVFTGLYRLVPSRAKQAKAVLRTETLEAVYFSSLEILACHEAGITVTLPKPQTSGAKSDGRFGKQDFVYLPEEDAYRCPAGEQLPYRFTSEEDGKRLRRYWTTACQDCSLKSQCTTGPERRIPRWEHEHLLEGVQQRLDANPQAMRQRRETVEHPFGTMKARMGATHFLTKTIPKVAAEMAPSVLAYNLTRVMNIVGIKPLIAAIAA